MMVDLVYVHLIVLQWLAVFKMLFSVKRMLDNRLHDFLDLVWIVIVEFLRDLHTLFMYNSILQVIVCNSVSIYQKRTVL